MAVTKDPLAEALSKATKKPPASRKMRVEELYGDRPAVIEAIVSMRRDRGMSIQEISDHLQALDGEYISTGALRTYLQRRGAYE